MKVKLEEIKNRKKVYDDIRIGEVGDFFGFEDIDHLLSIIEQAEKSLTQIEKHPLPQHHLCESFLTVQIVARQALKDIQGEG